MMRMIVQVNEVLSDNSLQTIFHIIPTTNKQTNKYNNAFVVYSFHKNIKCALQSSVNSVRSKS